MYDALIPITITLLLTLAACAYLYYRYKARVKRLETMVRLVELGGGQVDSGLIRQLSQSGNGYKQDLKVGMIWLAIGIPLSLHVLFEEPAGVFAALIPVFIGVAYLVAGKYRLREPDQAP